MALTIGGILPLNAWSSRPVGKEVSLRRQRNRHIPDNSLRVIDYNGTAQSSGAHYELIAPWGMYDEPVPYGRILHNRFCRM